MSESRRLPARVYWVRRLVVLGIPLILVRGRACGSSSARLGRDDPAPDAQTTSAHRSPSRARRPTDDAGVAGCAPAVLSIAMTPDAVSFAAGVSATFTVSITNTGTEALPGRRGRGRTARSSSPPARTGCGPAATASSPARRRASSLLPAGGNDTTSFAWNRIRSAEGCPPGPARARRRHLLRAAHPRRRRAPRRRCSGWARRTARGCSTRPAGTVPRARPGRAARRRRRRP